MRIRTGGGGVVNFDEMLEQVLALVQRQGRVSYRAIKRRFDVDDAYLADLREEILTFPRISWYGAFLTGSVTQRVRASPTSKAHGSASCSGMDGELCASASPRGGQRP